MTMPSYKTRKMQRGPTFIKDIQMPLLPLELIIIICNMLFELDAESAIRACLVLRSIPLKSLSRWQSSISSMHHRIIWKSISDNGDDDHQQAKKEIARGARSITHIHEGLYHRKITKMVLLDGDALSTVISRDFTSLRELIICDAKVSMLRLITSMPPLKTLIFITDKKYCKISSSDRDKMNFGAEMRLPQSLRHHMKRWQVQSANIYFINIINSFGRASLGAYRHHKFNIDKYGFQSATYYTVHADKYDG